MPLRSGKNYMMSTTNSGGNTGHVGQVPVTHLKAPYLKDSESKTVWKFLKDREQYERVCKEKQDQGFDLDKIRQKVQSTIDPVLLRNIKRYELKIALDEDVTDEELLKVLKSKTTEEAGSVSCDIEAWMKSKLTWKMSSDVRTRVLQLFSDFEEELELKSMGYLLEKDSKQCIKMLLEAVRPMTLKRRIQEDLKTTHRDCKKDLAKFYDLLGKRAEYCEMFREEEKSLEQSGKGGKAKEKKKDNKTRSEEKGSDGSESKQKEKKKKPPKCWACEKEHRIDDCPKVTDKEEREKIRKAKIEEFRKERENRKANRTGGSGPENLMEVTLEGLVKAQACADTGAQDVTIGRNMLEKLKAAGIKVDETLLAAEDQYEVRGAFKGDVEWTTVCGSTAKLRSLIIHTSGGPLELEEVNCAVLEGTMDELLLSEGVLNHLGISVKDQLADVARKRSKWNVSSVKVGQGALQKVLRTRLVKEKKYLESVTRQSAGTESYVLEMESESGSEELQEEVRAIRRVIARSPGMVDDGDREGPDETNIIGDNDMEQVRKGLRKMLDHAKEQGAGETFLQGMEKLLDDYIDVFRLKLGKDAPVKVAPMVVELVPGTVPERAKPRRYGPLEEAYLRREAKKMEKLGLYRRNNKSAWAAPSLVLKKRFDEKQPIPEDPLDGLRWVVDLRTRNLKTKKVIHPMPNLEVIMSKLRNKRCFGKADAFKAFWQLALAESCQELFSILVPDGVVTPTRVPMGATNSVAHFQAAMQEVLGDLAWEHILIWLDDFLLHAENETELLEIWERMFKKCEEYGLKLHAEKCSLYETEVKWCGKYVSGEGVRQDETRIAALRDMSQPETGADLQQFVCGIGWMKTSLPKHSEVMAPLMTFMELVYKTCKSRKKRKVAAVKLKDLGWGSTEDQAWEAARELLLKCVKLAHPDEAKDFNLFTDASMGHWGAVLTQTPVGDRDKAIEERKHEPLGFMSGSFKGAQEKWSTIEKEAFAIVYPVQRWDYMLRRAGGFKIYTDHRNLEYIFRPESMNVKRYTADKLQRWVMILGGFHYEIHHIDGERNVLGDMFSRWAAPQSTGIVRVVKRLYSVPPLNYSGDVGFEWPTMERIRNVQREHTAEAPSSMTRDATGLWKDENGRIWIPDAAVELQFRLCCIAHSGAAGHRGAGTTAKELGTRYQWRTLKDDVNYFVKECHHCLSRGPNKMPRPLGEQLHSDTPNEVHHFDFIFIQKDVTGGPQYVFMQKDDATNLVKFTACRVPEGAVCVDALMEWAALFGMPKTWVSDSPTHMVNALMEGLAARYHAVHHAVCAYSPWANGSVEVVGRDLLQVLRSLLQEWRLPFSDWPKLLVLVETVLNHSLSPKLGNIAPTTAMTGLPAQRPIDFAVEPGRVETVSLAAVESKRAELFDKLKESKDFMHQQAAGSAQRRRTIARKQSQLAKSHLPKFQVGSLVMEVRELAKRKSKLVARWTGPRICREEVCPWVWRIEDPVTGVQREVHASRLKPYSERATEVTSELLDQIQYTDASYFVQAFTDLRQTDVGDFEVRATWRGFQDTSDETWEPVVDMLMDVPNMLAPFLRARQDSVGKACLAHFAAALPPQS